MGDFVIQELPNGETFSWSNSAQSGLLGAMAAPRRPWSFGSEMRNVTKWYAGAVEPSLQMLGPMHQPFDVRGMFNDRFNEPGWARSEMNRFRAMCERGNLVRVRHAQEEFDGIITRWEFDYHYDWRIEYQFSFQPSKRAEQELLQATQLPAERLGEQIANIDSKTEALMEALIFSSSERDTTLEGIIVQTSAEVALQDAIEARENFYETYDNSARTIPNSTPLKRMATQVREVRQSAYSMSNELIAAKSSTHLEVKTALSVLSFESWSRTAKFQAHLLMHSCNVAADLLDAEDDPPATRIYRPKKGESLYHISRLFYGTPYAWRAIAERNRLPDVELTGNEVLIIPEAGGIA